VCRSLLLSQASPVRSTETMDLCRSERLYNRLRPSDAPRRAAAPTDKPASQLAMGHAPALDESERSAVARGALLHRHGKEELNPARPRQLLVVLCTSRARCSRTRPRA
jgi:hypothetical protein